MIALVALLSLAQQAVSFPAQDGAPVSALGYGKGDRAVVLAHGGRFNKESWAPQATVLAAAGFRALSIDFRDQGGKGHWDVLAAVHYLRNTGAKSVYVGGASMGGDYAAEAAEAEPAAIDRLVLLASGAYTPLKHMTGPKLFILARDDANGDGPRLPRIRAQFALAHKPKKLIVLDGAAHAQFLFQTNQSKRLLREILRFLSSPPT